MHKLFVFAASGMLCLLVGCSGTPEPESELMPNPLSGGDSGPETPMDERIVDLLQEAKQQYDDGHYDKSMRYAEKAEGLIVEHQFPEEDLAMARIIKGYCLLQLKLIDDYYIDGFGKQAGAITTFGKALEIREEDFRSQLGISLAKFRRHADSVQKAEALAGGIIQLESIREDFRRGLAAADTDQGKALLREAGRKLSVFKGNRDQMTKLGFIFRDPRSLPIGATGPTGTAKWLGSVSEEDSIKDVNDMDWIMEDALKGEPMSSRDKQGFDFSAAELADSWRTVRKYWRLQALKDLQSARDGFMRVRELDARIAEETGRMVYFWVDRDLTFVFQSLGAFFLDSGLEAARMKAIAEGVSEDRLEARAREIYLDKNFVNEDKIESRRNYEAALTYTESFVRGHKRFEDLRRRRVNEAELGDENANPFMVDLVKRYRTTMDELIESERTLRSQMILEAAALCIDPLFQISDIRRANNWANELKSLDLDDPIHHFVRATAYYQTGDYETALQEYQAFMNGSSISEHGNRRSLARQRIAQCEQHLSRKAGAGEDDGR
ncbi:MAG: hypothetical protein H6841_04005 [Planctomycetes bacterium]|nr:hypothetical protein [Planctomycetota bacterium]MCB9934540.1 hypothetical protein [Planctomycetota bacterium]